MSRTVGQVIEGARVEDPAFTPENHPNRVALSWLSDRQQDFLKRLSDDLVDRFSETRSIADTIDNALVGVDSDGTAYTVETSGDGYDVIAEVGDAVDIVSSSAATPTVITATAHGLITLDSITISDHDGSDDDDGVNTSHQVTYLTDDTFSIPVDLTGGGGTGGTLRQNHALYTGPTLIAQDPYSDGFPLPADFIKIVSIYAVFETTEAYAPVVVVPQHDIAVRAGSSGKFHAIISADRLVPILSPPNNTGASRWDAIEKVTFTWIDNPVRFTETGSWTAQTFTVPDLYANALQYGLAAFFGRRQQSIDSAFPPETAAALDSNWKEARDEALYGATREVRSLKTSTTRRNR